MLDIRILRRDPEAVRKNIARRNNPVHIERLDLLLKTDTDFRLAQHDLESKRSEHNNLTRQIAARRKGGGDSSELERRAGELSAQIQALERELNTLEARRGELLKLVPNLLDEKTPDGPDESANPVVRTVGEKPVFDFPPKSQVDLIEALDFADTERAAKISGARFYFMKRELVLLDLSVLRLALDMLVGKGFVPLFPPEMMRRESYEGVTPMGDFEETMYKIEGDDLYLIATSEHPLVAMHSGETLEASQLPLKYAGLSVNFRREAGAHGRDTKGMFRVHNFNKVEQVVFCRPEDSPSLLAEILQNAEEIFQALEIPYRVVEICSGDISAKNSRQFDIEAWLPAQNTYREVVSASNCTSYQSASLKIRYRLKQGGAEKEYVHTLNSTAVATPRALLALIENHQEKDGSITLPKALQKYMDGRTELRPFQTRENKEATGSA